MGLKSLHIFFLSSPLVPPSALCSCFLPSVHMLDSRLLSRVTELAFFRLILAFSGVKEGLTDSAFFTFWCSIFLGSKHYDVLHPQLTNPSSISAQPSRPITLGSLSSPLGSCQHRLQKRFRGISKSSRYVAFASQDDLTFMDTAVSESLTGNPLTKPRPSEEEKKDKKQTKTKGGGALDAGY